MSKLKIKTKEGVAGKKVHWLLNAAKQFLPYKKSWAVNGKLKSSITSPFGIYTALESFAGISVTLRNQA